MSAPALDRGHWQHRALCAKVDPALFFPGIGDDTGAGKRICTQCPVQAECREFALANDIQFGTFGGLSAYQRRQIRQPHQSKCGTRSGYRRHKANDEEPCPACRAASNAYSRKLDRQRRLRQPLRAAS